MADNIFEDLKKLFEECDDVTKTFYDSDGKDGTIANEANCSDTLDGTTVSSQEDKPKLPDSEASVCSEKHDWKTSQTDHRITDISHLEHESSREEGECTKTFEESKLGPVMVSSKSGMVLQQKQRKDTNIRNKSNYSSFIDSSKEEGECSTTSFEEDDLETTILAVWPEKADEKSSEVNKENNQLLTFKNQRKEIQRDICSTHIRKKRKRSLSEKNERTPKRRHLFVTEDVLSPISCCSADKRKITLETAETPIIESKFSSTPDDVGCSTPITKEQIFLFPTSNQCSTPIISTNADNHSKLTKKEILKTEVSSDSDPEFLEIREAGEANEKYQTVDELIADITKLCEESDESVQTENENIIKSSNKSLSKIEVNDLISEWKTLSSESTDGDNDKTLTDSKGIGSQSEETENSKSDIENLTIISTESAFKKAQTGKEKDESSTDDRGGRFKAEVTVSRIEGEEGNETNREAVDMDIFDGHEEEIQYGDDLLNLNDYDDEGFVDENILESSHLTKNLNLTVKRKEAREDSSKDKEKKIEENVHSLFNLVQSLRENDEQTETEKKTDVNRNVVRGLDYASFDTSIYRKKDNTAIEREVCRRWGTNGSADPDVNLTVATTKRNRYRETGQRPEVGFLEGDKVVCTYMYEEEIMSTFEHYGKTDGQSDLCYMPLRNLLNKLYNQKEILENMNRQSLLNIKQELQWQLKGTKASHHEEVAYLSHRQSMEEDYFKYNTRRLYNIGEFQKKVMQLRQEHLFQERQLSEHHQYEYNAVRSHGMKILNEEISRLDVQCEPINQLIAQLEKPQSHAMSSPQKYGPPIVVSLRKGPCRASDGKHSTVAVCLSAGIAQAVSLEDDLYDHYYSY